MSDLDVYGNDSVTALVEFMTPAAVEFVTDMNALFERIEYVDHELTVANSVTDTYETEAIDNADTVINAYYEHGIALLLKVGIRVSNGIEFVKLGELCTAVFDIEREHNRDVLVEVLNQELDSEQTLARLLGEITEDSETRWYAHFTEVDHAFVARLKQAASNEELLYEYDQFAADIKEKYNMVTSVCTPSLVQELSPNFQQLPIAVEPIMQMYSEVMEDMMYTDVAAELITLSVLSGSLERDEVEQKSTELLTRYFDPGYAMLANLELTKLLDEVF